MQLFLVFLAQSTLLLLFGGCAIGLLLRLSGCQSPVWNRFAWAFVLLLGVACLRLPLEIPVLTPQTISMPATSQAVDATVLPVALETNSITESPVPPRAWFEFFTTYIFPLIFAGWLCGAALFFVMQLFFWFKAVRLTKDAAIPEDFFHSEWKRLLDVYGLDSRKIELRTAAGVGPVLLRLPTTLQAQ